MNAKAKGRRASGFTLVELLIAMAIALILVAGLWRFFLGQQKTFTAQDEVTRMQQKARIAEDFMLKAIQQAGAHSYVEGVTRGYRPPAILAASDRYIAVQYDDPQGDLPGTVTAGEVVIFALGKDTGGATEKVADDPTSSTVEVYYDADRDGEVEESESFDLSIDMNLGGPPYNLYRITPDPNNPGGIITPPEVIATNVDNLVLRYFDQNGNRMPFNGTTRQPLPYGGTGSILNREERDQIRLVEVELLLRGDNADPNYTPSSTEEVTLEAGTVGTNNAGGTPSATAFVFPAADQQYRRRSYRTLITPRILGAINCGKIVLEGDPVICPADGTVTATVLDKNEQPVPGAQVIFTLPGAPLAASLSPTSGTTDANGRISTTVTYQLKSRSLLVAARAENVDCDGVPVTLNHAISLSFNPGPAALVYYWADPDPDGDPTTARYGFLPSEDPKGDWLGTCREDKYYFWAAILDECGNLADSIPGGLDMSSIDAASGGPFGQVDGLAASPVTQPIQKFEVKPGTTGGIPNPADGRFTQLIRGSTPPWLKNWYADASTPPIPIYSVPDPTTKFGWPAVPPNQAASLDVWPFPAKTLRWMPDPPPNIARVFDEKDLRTDPIRHPPPFDQFEVIDCHENRVYTLNIPVSSGYVTAVLEGGSTSPEAPEGARGEIGSRSPSYTVNGTARDVQDPSIFNDIAIQISEATPTTGGLWDVTYNWPYCAVDPSKFSVTNPERPKIALNAVDTIDPPPLNPFSGSIDTTPVIPPGRTCEVTVSQFVVNPYPCQAATKVTVGGCDYGDKDFEVEIKGGADPKWINPTNDPNIDIQSDRIAWVKTDSNGYKTIELDIGDSTISGSTIEVVARSRPVNGQYAWTCPDNGTLDQFVVDNKCTNFRAYYRTALGEVDLQDAGRYCASVLKELFFRIEHCKTDLAPLPNALRLEVYDQYGQLYDKEDVVLEAIGTTIPVTGFRGSIVTQANPMNHGNFYDKQLDYPKGKAGTVKIYPWADAADPTDQCPSDPWILELIPPVPICFPNAITSGGGASWNGNFKVHWGDVVVRGNMTKPSQLIEKLETGQFDGSSFLGKSSLTDRFVDVYIGRSDSGIANDGLITGYPLPVGWTGYVYQPFLPTGGNYFTNITREKISKMVVSLNYEVMKNLALNHSKNAYWVSLIDNGKTKVFNPRTNAGPILLADLLNNPNTAANPNNNGDFLFIDTWGVKTATGWSPPPTTGADIDNMALANTLPVHDIAGTPFYTTGIIYVAGSVTFGGLGNPRTMRVETPPGKDLHYLHNSPLLWTPTDDTLPVRPDPAEPREQFDVSVHINGAIYLDGDFRGAGNPAVYGALTSERGYSGMGTPEVWYNYTLNETGIQNALCVECCSIAARPAILDLLPGNTQTLTITNGSGQLLFRSSNPAVATVDQNGLVTAVGSGFAIVWVVDSNNCTVAVPVRTATQCVGLKILPEMVPDPNDPADTFDITNGVKPVHILNIQDPTDPTGGYPIAHWEWSADKNPAGQDVVTIAPQGVLNPQPNVGNNYTAIITGQRCGQTTVRAKDLTGICTSIYESVVTVGSALDITGINPDKSDYRVGETVTLTATGGTGTTLWHTLPSANVSLSTNAGPTTQMTFKAPGIVQVDVSDDLNCVSEIHDFYAKCSQVTGTTTSPVAGSYYGLVYGKPTMVWSVAPYDDFGTNPTDQIARVEFYVWPDPTTETGSRYISTDTTAPYCAFGDDGLGGCKAGDISSWLSGNYTLEARIYSTAYSCGPTSASIYGSTYINNCTMQFYDYFDTALPKPQWMGTCLNDGCNLAMSKFYNSGSRMILELKNKTSSFGPYFVTLNPASVPVSFTDDFYMYAQFLGSDPVGNSSIGLTTLSTAGTHLTILGSPHIGTDGTVWYTMALTYNGGGGTVPVAPSSGSGTELKAPFYIEIWETNGAFYAYAWDNMGYWTYWTGPGGMGFTLPASGTYYNGILLNGPSAFDGSAAGAVDFFYQTCY